MTSDLGLLVLTAGSIGFIHTRLGPAHYLPFIAMSAARGWTTRRTLVVTALCGLGHVLGSVVIGGIGIGVGVSLYRLEWVEGACREGNNGGIREKGFPVSFIKASSTDQSAGYAMPTRRVFSNSRSSTSQD